jgi:hypothetical protein
VQVLHQGRAEAPSGGELARLTRAFRDRLEPLGYAPVKLRGAMRQSLVMFDKGVRTLSEARRERERLDRVVFAD